MRGGEGEVAGGGLAGRSAEEEAKRVVGEARLCNSVVCGASGGADGGEEKEEEEDGGVG